MNNIITIVTPSLNQGQYISRAIESVLSQAGDFYVDYIIADGGSTDETVEIIKKYEQLLKEKKYPINCLGIEFKWWSRPDKGQTNALNLGFQQAKGDILAWINCDDYYEPGAFQTVAKVFSENPDIDLIYGSSYQVYGGERKIIAPKAIKCEEMINTGYQLNQPAVFFTRRIFCNVGLLDESLHYAMDFDLWIKILKQGRLFCVQNILATSELWENCKGMKFAERFSAETRKVCRKHDKNPFSKRSVSMFLAKFKASRKLKEKIPAVYNFGKKIISFFYKNKNLC